MALKSYLFLALVLFSRSITAAGVPPPTANTALGAIKGTTCNSDTSAFLGIPFAKTPTGYLRFKAPVPYDTSYPADGYKAGSLKPACIQFGTTFIENPPWSEDCLFLNVWAPPNATPGAKLPVKFWVHGGSNLSGGTSNPIYNGCNSAKDSIVVTTAYRLGPLGFLSLDKAGIQGNMGVQDVLLALEWVQNNIAAFGGDPKSVLLFGESAGAALVWTIGTLTQAPRLVNAVIAESGGGWPEANRQTMQQYGEKFAANIKCSVHDIACFQSKKTSELNSSMLAPTKPSRFSVSLGPFVDGQIIPTEPLSVGSRVPFMAGSNFQDGTLFPLSSTLNNDPTKLQEKDYINYVKGYIGEDKADPIVKHFPISRFEKDYPTTAVYQAMSYVATLGHFRCPSRKALEATNDISGKPAFSYIFNVKPSCGWIQQIPNDKEILSLLGATHTAEIPFVHSILQHMPPPDGTCFFNEKEIAVSNVLAAGWSSMASRGEPGRAAGLLDREWSQWNKSSSFGLNADDSPSVGFLDYSDCDFMDQYLD